MGRATSVDPMLWYVCKFCNRAYQEKHLLVAHKRLSHLDKLKEKSQAEAESRAEVIVKHEAAVEDRQTTPTPEPANDLALRSGSKKSLGSKLKRRKRSVSTASSKSSSDIKSTENSRECPNCGKHFLSNAGLSSHFRAGRC